MLLRAALFVLAAAAGASFLRAEQKTVITGDQMEILRGGQTVIFDGNAKVTRGNSVLSADRLVQHKKSQLVEAAGAVSFSTINGEGELLRGASGKAQYSVAARQGELWDNRPALAYYMKTSTAPMTIEADRISFDETTEEVSARGQVVIVSSSVMARSPQARFEQKEKKVTLSKGLVQPELIYQGSESPGRYHADSIIVLVEQRKVFMAGNVYGVMAVQDSAADKAGTDASGKQKP